MVTIIVSLDTSQKLVALALPPLVPAGDSNGLVITNQTGSQLFMAQMVFNDPWVNGPSGEPPTYRTPTTVGLGSVQISYYPAIKAYVGFAINDGSNEPTAESMLAGVPTDDSWFLSPPAMRNVVPLRFTSSIEVVLNPQTDPNPPHNVHPVTAMTVHWDANNPMLCATNRSGGNVTMYVRIFYKDGTAPTDSAFPLSTPLSYYRFPTNNITFQKAWYGFAFNGQYSDATAYFAVHPQGDGHHTKEIPPTDEEGDGTTDAASA